MRVLLDMAMTPSLSGLAVSGLLAFTTLTRSLQLISPNLVSSLRSLELVLAFLVQAAITGQPPQTLSWLGGGLILIGNNSNEMFVTKHCDSVFVRCADALPPVVDPLLPEFNTFRSEGDFHLPREKCWTHRVQQSPALIPQPVAFTFYHVPVAAAGVLTPVFHGYFIADIWIFQHPLTQ